jgi:hypothetical protein
MAKIFNDFHCQIFVQMFVFNSCPKKQHSLYKKSAGNCHDSKKMIDWDLFHLKRPLVTVSYYIGGFRNQDKKPDGHIKCQLEGKKKLPKVSEK